MIKAYAVTFVGPVRSKNQDGFFLNGMFSYEDRYKDVYYESDDNNLIAFVADGVGSTQDGEYAVEKATTFFSTRRKYISSKTIASVINDTNEFINTCASKSNKVCAATIAGVIVDSDITVFNVGDSKIFSVNNGYLEQISKDDTAATMLQESAIDSTGLIIDTKLPLIQYLGNPDVSEIETHIANGLPAKDIILCTDGITDMVSIDEIEDILEEENNIKDRVKKIINKAVLNGGNDNITLMYISFE